MDKINIDKLNKLEKSGAIDSKAASDLRDLHGEGMSIKWSDAGKTYEYVDDAGGSYAGKTGKGTRKGLFRGLSKKHKNISDALAQLKSAGGFDTQKKLVKKTDIPASSGTSNAGNAVTNSGTGDSDGGGEDKDMMTQDEIDAMFPDLNLPPAETLVPEDEKKEDTRIALKPKYSYSEKGFFDKGVFENFLQGANVGSGAGVLPSIGRQLDDASNYIGGTILDIFTPFSDTDYSDDAVKNFRSRQSIATAKLFGNDYDEFSETIKERNFVDAYEAGLIDKEGNPLYIEKDGMFVDKHGEMLTTGGDPFSQLGLLAPDVTGASGKVYNSTLGKLRLPKAVKSFYDKLAKSKGLDWFKGVGRKIDDLFPGVDLTGKSKAITDESRMLLQKNPVTSSGDNAFIIPTGKAGGKLVPKYQAGRKSREKGYDANPSLGGMFEKQRGSQSQLLELAQNSFREGMQPKVAQPTTQLVPKLPAQTTMPDLGPVTDQKGLLNFDGPAPESSMGIAAVDPKLINRPVGNEALPEVGGGVEVEDINQKRKVTELNQKQEETGDYINTGIGDFSKNQLAAAGIHELLTKTPKFSSAQMEKLGAAPQKEGLVERGLTAGAMDKFETDASNIEAAGDTTSNSLVNRQDDLSRALSAQTIRTEGNLANEVALVDQEKINRDTANENLVAKDSRASQNLKIENQQRRDDNATDMANQGAKDARQHSFRDTVTGLLSNANYNKRAAEGNTMVELDNVFKSEMSIAEAMPISNDAEVLLRKNKIKSITDAHRLKRAELVKRYAGVTLDKNLFQGDS